jgi:hypothetical protein
MHYVLLRPLHEQIMNCVELDNGERYLLADLSINCNTSKFYSYKMVLVHASMSLHQPIIVHYI